MFFWGRVVIARAACPVLQVPDSRKHVLQRREAKKWVFQGCPTQKMAIFAQKWPRNANFGPKTVFSGLGWPVLGPSHAIFQVPDSNKHVLQGMKAGKSVLHGRPTQKMAIFAQKWPTNANFGAKTVFFGLGWAVLGPPTPYFVGARPKKNVLQGMGRELGVSPRPPPPEIAFFAQKWPFLAQNWPKNANFGPKTVFFGLG